MMNAAVRRETLCLSAVCTHGLGASTADAFKAIVDLCFRPEETGEITAPIQSS